MPQAASKNLHPSDVPRWVYLLSCVPVIPAGLASRHLGSSLPRMVSVYGGDTLWALFFYLVIRALRPQSSLAASAVACLVFSALIETSQLFHPPWLSPIRRTLFGQLVLGEDFLWSDLVCYTVGVALGVTWDGFLQWRWQRKVD